jgi:uncharacterized peroxidase-related enzyme
MARLKVIDPTTTTGKLKEVFEGPLKGKHINLFKGLGNSPAALQAYLDMGTALSQGVLTPKEREVVALAVSETNGCNYCAAAHTALGKAAGLTEAQTIGARRGKMEDPKLATLSRFTQAMVEKRGFVSDNELSDMRKAGYGDGHIAEAVAVLAQTVFTNYFNHLNDTEIDFPIAPPLK